MRVSILIEILMVRERRLDGNDLGSAFPNCCQFKIRTIIQSKVTVTPNQTQSQSVCGEPLIQNGGGRGISQNSWKKCSHLKCISSTCQALSPVCQKFPIDGLNLPSLRGRIFAALLYFLRFCASEARENRCGLAFIIHP